MEERAPVKQRASKGKKHHSPAHSALFKLFLKCLVLAASACLLSLRFDVVSILERSWLYIVMVASTALLMLVAGMISPRLYGNRSSRDALRDSIGKIKVLAKFLFPIFLFYGDLVSDILVIRRFWSEGYIAYGVLNCLAILAGAVSSVVSGVHDFSTDSMLLVLMICLQLTPLAVAVQATALFCAAIDCSGTDPRYKSLEGYLRDEGCATLLARSIAGEAFTEALLSIFVQTYAILRHAISLNHLTIASLLFSIGSIIRSFASLDKRGHVSREIRGQGIVVGLAEWTSLPFILVVVYRAAEVSSQVLFFPLFQLMVDVRGPIFGLRYTGGSFQRTRRP